MPCMSIHCTYNGPLYSLFVWILDWSYNLVMGIPQELLGVFQSTDIAFDVCVNHESYHKISKAKYVFYSLID